MGSFNSHPTPTPSVSSTDGLNTSKSVRRSKRIIEKLRSRQSSRSDDVSAQSSRIIDPYEIQLATQNLDIPNKDHDVPSADLDQITLKWRGEESAINKSTRATPSSEKPVLSEDRQATHTSEEVESTKQNADKAVSFNSTATDRASRQENFPCENSEKKTFSAQFHAEVCQKLTESEAAKSWESRGVRTDPDIFSYDDDYREVQTSTSELNLPLTSNDSDNLTIRKLEKLSLNAGLPKLHIVQYEPINFDGGTSEDYEENEMPIVKKKIESGQQENGTDKGIFSVSRVKKVELSGIPLTPDICANPTPEQPTVTTPTQTGNGGTSNVTKTSNGSSKVLHRVITLTTANHGEANVAAKAEPKITPGKLPFSPFEKFEGQMLMNWFAQSISSSMTISLNENDLSALTLQYCNNLLNAGVIRQVDASIIAEGFKANLIYQWTQKAPPTSTPATPGRLETANVWPPPSQEKKTSPKSREGESKIPKLMSSTPKARIQLVSSLLTMSDQSPLTLLNGTETDHNKVNELKSKIAKCETIQEMFMLIKSFLNEYSMHSSESSSTNSGIFNGSILNGTESTVFDRSSESTVFSVLNNRSQETGSSVKGQITPKKTVKSRTAPSTPLGSANRLDPKKIRRNLSVDSVNNAVSTPQKSIENGTGCKRCAKLQASPKQTCDKATVMDVEPIIFEKAPELKCAETQTEPPEDDKPEISTKEVSAPAPPPPPMMNVPPPPPPPAPNAPNIPGPPPPPPPGGPSSGLPPMPPPLGIPGAPMPLPPPISLNSGPALRKNAVNPPKPMKPLYWTRIVAPKKSIDVVDGVQSAASSPEEKSSDDDDELWKEIDETKLDNLDEFTELFSRQGVIPKAKTSTPLPKIKAIKVLDSKRSQNVGIFVRSIHVEFAEIEHAIYHCETGVVSLETLQHIMEIKATNEELNMIKEAVAAHTEGQPPLDTPENFLYKISQISSSAERISCIVFQAEFEEQYTLVSRKLATVNKLCEFLLEDQGLKEIFSIILTLGNFMNGGNRQRGQADGFGLEILGKLKDVKSKDPKITLLHFIVKTYIERCRKSGCAFNDIPLPTPDPNDVDKSLFIDFEECKQQLNTLKSKVEECKKTIEKVIAASPEDSYPFKEKMEKFLETALKKIDGRFYKLNDCQVIFIKTLKFYKFTPKGKITLEETTPGQFFEYWTSFTSDFNDIFKKEILILTNEILKKSRQATKPQSKPTSGENNLKARINRLKNRN